MWFEQRIEVIPAVDVLGMEEVDVIPANERRDVLHDPTHAIELLEHDIDRGPLLGRRGVRWQHLQMPPADGDRGSQLVRCQRQEARPSLVQPSELPRSPLLVAKSDLQPFTIVQPFGHDRREEERRERDRRVDHERLQQR